MAEVSQITHEDHHRGLVRQLASGVKPTRRLWPVGARLGLWVLLEIGVFGWVVTHTDNDFLHKFRQPSYAIEIVLFAVAAVISAILALRSTIPGRTFRADEAVIG